MSNGCEAAGGLERDTTDSDGGGGHHCGTCGESSGAEDTQQNTLGPEENISAPAAVELPATMTPPPSPSSTTKTAFTADIKLLPTSTIHSQEEAIITPEDNTAESYAVYSKYVEEDGTKEPLLRPSPGQDEPSNKAEQEDGAAGNNNGTAAGERLSTEKTFLLPPLHLKGETTKVTQ